MARHRIVARLLLAWGVVAAAHAPAASAGLNNGSFETGFDGWSTIGDTSIQGTGIGIAPTNGHAMAFLTTLCDATRGPGCSTIGIRELPYSERNAVGFGAATQFLGFAYDEVIRQGRAGFEGEGSAIRREIVARAGDTLSFDAYYVTTETLDNAFFTLVPADGGAKTLLFLNRQARLDLVSPVALCERQILPLGNDPCGTAGPGANRTDGWQHVSVVLPTSGVFTFGFGLSEIADGTVPSALFIDNVELSSVPGPPALALASFGALLLWIRRRLP